MEEPGCIIKCSRSVFSHVAVYVGNGKVVHFTNDSSVTEEDYKTVRGESSSCEIEFKKSPFSNEEIVKRARSKIGEKTFGEYDLAKNNCEHFANWCRYGEKISKQVKDTAQKVSDILETSAKVSKRPGAAKRLTKDVVPRPGRLQSLVTKLEEHPSNHRGRFLFDTIFQKN